MSLAPELAAVARQIADRDRHWRTFDEAFTDACITARAKGYTFPEIAAAAGVSEAGIRKAVRRGHERRAGA